VKTYAITDSLIELYAHGVFVGEIEREGRRWLVRLFGRRAAVCKSKSAAFRVARAVAQ
jgi:hypothetical protein